MSDVSVIICTHNPIEPLLERSLVALEQQTLNSSRWDLVVVDNGSTPPVAMRMNRPLPRNARCVSELKLGLTAARLRGISESSGSLIVFVDDDAVLSANYLEVALQLSRNHSFLGAFGGSIVLEFDEPPEEWTRLHWPRLAERHVQKPVWSNFNCNSSTTPWGVGMCLRRSVAEAYVRLVSDDPLRIRLDRSGVSLVSGGDEDMARTAHTLGLATGLFPELSLTHLIPNFRLKLDYLLRLVEGQSYSGIILNHIYKDQQQPPKINKLRRFLGSVRRRLCLKMRDRLILEAKLNGQQRALQDLGASG